MSDGRATPDRAAFEREWYVETPLRLPNLKQLWREWRCARKHGHGPDGFYHPHAIQSTSDWNLWLQECQACGRFTVWSERRSAWRQ